MAGKRRYKVLNASGESAEFVFTLAKGPAFLGGSCMVVMIERGMEFLEMIDLSHDDWALEDFGQWCVLRIRKYCSDAAAIEQLPPDEKMRLVL